MKKRILTTPKHNIMKRVLLVVCLLAFAALSKAQFEKGKWFVSPSLTGFELSHDTDLGKTSLGLQAKGGTFVMDNLALLINAGVNWNYEGSDLDTYSLGVGGRYYFDQVGVFTGANINMDRWYWAKDNHSTKVSLGLEAGYAFFLSRTVTIEPSVYWNINDDRSKLGLTVGFGFYF